MMSVLYGVSVSTINQHLKRIFVDGELIEEAVIKKYLTTAADGKKYKTNHYNLQAIIAVGFKVNNERAVQFRKWAGQIVKDYTFFTSSAICQNRAGTSKRWFTFNR